MFARLSLCNLLIPSLLQIEAFQTPQPKHFLLSPIPPTQKLGIQSPLNPLSTSTNHRTKLQSSSSKEESDNVRSVNTSIKRKENCWNPNIRKIFTVLSGIGMVETGYLTYLKVFDPNGIGRLCGGGEGESGGALLSCSSVLNSPYATVQINDEMTIPLTAVGFIAYASVAMLAAFPLVSSQTKAAIGTPGVSNDIATNNCEEENYELDSNNRIAILCTTTSMATFSSFLLSILFNTLHQSCPFCLLSATLSLTMVFMAWFSGMLPSANKENGFKLCVGSFLSTTIASLILFLGVDEAAMVAYRNDIMSSSGFTNNVVASAAKEDVLKNVPPPPITATSSPRALKIGEDMKELNTRFFGAYWCSHCYDQKQRMGKEAMANVQYIECSPEGLNSQTSICKERGVPGYPTWEIGGKLYPGEMYLDELEDIIVKAKTESSN